MPRQMSALVALLTLLVLVFGCDSGKQDGAATGQKAPEPLQAEAGQPKLSPDSVTNASLDQLKGLQKSKDSAKVAYDKSPTDAVARQKYIAATVRLGTATMLSEALDRKVKYRDALHLYREALKLDPKNEEALSWSKQIEDIYRSLNRPIPE